MASISRSAERSRVISRYSKRALALGLGAGALASALLTHGIDSKIYSSRVERAKTAVLSDLKTRIASVSPGFEKFHPSEVPYKLEEHLKNLNYAAEDSKRFRVQAEELQREKDEFSRELVWHLFQSEIGDSQSRQNRIRSLVNHDELIGSDVERAFAVKEMLSMAKSKGVSQATTYFEKQAKEISDMGGSEWNYFFRKGQASALRDLLSSPRAMNELGLQREIKPPAAKKK